MIPAGGRLKESLLAQEFGVSRNTVRGSLALLEFQGLSRYATNRGWVVWRPTQEDLMDVYLTRFYLETAAARVVGPSTDFTPLKRALDQLFDALETEDTRGIVEADFNFHGEIVALMGSQRLNEYYKRLTQELKYSLAILSTSDVFGHHAKDWRSMHTEIFFALTSGDAERATKVVGDTVLASREEVLRSLNKEEQDDDSR